MDNSAASAAFQFIVAGSIMMASLSGMMLAANGAGPESAPAAPGASGVEYRDAHAAAIGDILLNSRGAAGDQAWELDADATTRLGLLAADGGLDYAKFENLRQAPATATADGFLSYAEAAAVLGLSDSGGFHIRAYPTFVEDRKTLSEAGLETNLRVAYIGNWIDEDDVTNDVNDDSQELVICHHPGTPAEKTKAIPSNAWGGHSGHGDTLGACTEDVPEPDPEPEPQQDRMVICHKPGTPAEKTKSIPLSAWGGHSGHGDYEGPCGSPAFPMDVCHRPGTAAQEDRTISSTDWDAHQSHGDTAGPCTSPPPGAGQPDGSVGAWSYMVEPEITAIADTVQSFCAVHANDALVDPSVNHTWSSARCAYLPSVFQGAVIGDEADILDELLPTLLSDTTGQATLEHVTVLVIGSGVDHSQFLGEASENAIQEWILEGGTVISYGSVEQDVEWLDILFDAGIGSSSGGIQAPDVTHPLLRTPHQLHWDGYATSTTGSWDLGNDASYFTHVVSQENAALLAVSKPGVFADGNVILTSWTLGDIYAQQPADDDAQAAGQEAAANFLLLSYRTVYLDYGPEIPDDRSVGAASRQMLMEHPTMGPIPVTVILYSW